MKSRLFAILFASAVGALALMACGAGAPPAASPMPSGDPLAGKAAYDGTCIACHGPDAQGLPSLGKDLTTSAFVAGLSDADLIAFIKQGRPSGDPANTTGVDMPPKGGNPAFSDVDLANIVAYIRTLSQ